MLIHLRLELIASGQRQKAIAAQLGISQSYLSAVLNGKKSPSDAVLKHFGLERCAPSYRRIK